MKVFEIIRAIVFSLPLGVFITFGLFLVITIQLKVRKINLVFRRLVACYCLLAVISSLLFLFYYYVPDLFVRLDLLYGFSVIFAIVLFYHFFCFAIRSGQSFPLFHYMIPLFVCVIMFFCKQFFSVFWKQEGKYVLFIVMLIWGIVYSILPLYKMHNYHLKLALASKTPETLNKTRAIPYIFEVVLFPLTFVVLPLITGQTPGISLSVLMMLCLLLALRMNIPLTYAIIRHYGSPMGEMSLFAPSVSVAVTDPVIKTVWHMRVADMQSVEITSKRAKRVYRKYTRKNHLSGRLIEIDKKVFEAYISKHKPYRNPELKIYDLVDPLQSNRTYISKFINNTYRMSFSSYMNLCRLQEVEKLMELPANKDKSPGVLISQAGFSNYRNYLRVKKQFRKDKSL